MTLETKQLGNQGEEMAVKYLKNKGYKILDRNFRYKGYGELDIIAKRGEDIVFVEVKTRLGANNDSPYNPEDNITYFKQKQLIKLAKIYLAKNPAFARLGPPWQIDIIAIEIGANNKSTIRHIEQAIEDLY